MNVHELRDTVAGLSRRLHISHFRASPRPATRTDMDAALGGVHPSTASLTSMGHFVEVELKDRCNEGQMNFSMVVG